MGKLIVTDTFDKARSVQPTTPIDPPTHTLKLGPQQSFTRIEVKERTLKWGELENLSEEHKDDKAKPIDVVLEHIFVDENSKLLNPIEAQYLLRREKHHPDTRIRVYEVKHYDIDRVRFNDRFIQPILLHNMGYEVQSGHEWTVRCGTNKALHAYAPLLYVCFSDEIHLRTYRVYLNEMLGNGRLRVITVKDLRELLGCISRASLDKYKKQLGLTRTKNQTGSTSATQPNAAEPTAPQTAAREEPQAAPQSHPEPASTPQPPSGEKTNPATEKPAQAAEESPEQTDLFD